MDDVSGLELERTQIMVIEQAMDKRRGVKQKLSEIGLVKIPCSILVFAHGFPMTEIGIKHRPYR